VDAELVVWARTVSESALSGLGSRWAHVQGVAGAAQRAVTELGCASAEAVVAAAWLHDVGYGSWLRRTGFHPVDGAKFAAGLGFPPLVVSLIAFHSGAAVEAAERGLSGELAVFPEPPSEVLDVLTFADMTTSPEGTPVSVEDRLVEILDRYEPSDVVHRAVSKSGSGLLAAVSRVQRRLAAVGKGC